MTNHLIVVVHNVKVEVGAERHLFRHMEDNLVPWINSHRVRELNVLVLDFKVYVFPSAVSVSTLRKVHIHIRVLHGNGVTLFSDFSCTCADSWCFKRTLFRSCSFGCSWSFSSCSFGCSFSFSWCFSCCSWCFSCCSWSFSWSFSSGYCFCCRCCSCYFIGISTRCHHHHECSCQNNTAKTVSLRLCKSEFNVFIHYEIFLSLFKYLCS